MITQDQTIVGPYVSRKVGLVWTPESMYAIGLVNSENEMIAGVIYERWKGVSFVVHIAVDGLMTPEYLKAIFHYPFIHSGAKKLIAPVASSNEKSIKFVEHLGFRKEAQLLDAHPGGSILLYTMKKEECKFLGEWHGRQLQSA